MPLFQNRRYDDIEYRYIIPTFAEVDKFVLREPTRMGFDLLTLCPGAIVWGKDDIWLCMDVVIDSSDVDVWWVHWDRNTKLGQKVQQVFDHNFPNTWMCSIFPVEVKTNLIKNETPLCPTCYIPLEWASLAERCPKCWYVKPVTADKGVLE